MDFNGIDVSKWNGTIDWEKLKNSGIDFAIILKVSRILKTRVANLLLSQLL